jgi:hypothetical protein
MKGGYKINPLSDIFRLGLMGLMVISFQAIQGQDYNKLIPYPFSN